MLDAPFAFILPSTFSIPWAMCTPGTPMPSLISIRESSKNLLVVENKFFVLCKSSSTLLGTFTCTCSCRVFVVLELLGALPMMLGGRYKASYSSLLLLKQILQNGCRMVLEGNRVIPRLNLALSKGALRSLLPLRPGVHVRKHDDEFVLSLHNSSQE